MTWEVGKSIHSFIVTTREEANKKKKHPFGLVEVSTQLKFFPCVSLPFWHIVSPDIRCFSCFFWGFGGGEGFLVKRRDQKSKEREKWKGGWRTDYLRIVRLLDFLNRNVGFVFEFQIDEST